MKVYNRKYFIYLSLFPMIFGYQNCGEVFKSDFKAVSSSITSIDNDSEIPAPLPGGEPVIIGDDIPAPQPLPTVNPASPIYKANILFSGHSLTDVAVPTVNRVSLEKSIDLNYLYQSIPGSPIRYRTSGILPYSVDTNWLGYSSGTPTAINLINELRAPQHLPNGERYDTLIITERHDIIGTIEWESTVSLLRHFHDRMLDGYSLAQTYFYQSWLTLDRAAPQIWINYEKNSLYTHECVSSKVNLTLQADDLPESVSTIGAGWALAHMVEAALNGEIGGVTGTRDQILDQIFFDNVHTHGIGTLFVGAFTFGVTFRQSPEGASAPAGITEIANNNILSLAWSLALQHQQRVDAKNRDMGQCRTFISEEVCPLFWGPYLRDNNNQINSCQNLFGSESNSNNPFKWPDPDLNIIPAPY